MLKMEKKLVGKKNLVPWFERFERGSETLAGGKHDINTVTAAIFNELLPTFFLTSYLQKKQKS